jgi:hypothetical protein
MSVLAEYFAFECKKFDSKLAVFLVNKIMARYQNMRRCVHNNIQAV